MNPIPGLLRVGVLVILIGGAILFAGCGKSDSGTSASSDAAASGDGVDAPAGKGDKEAVAAVTDELAKHWLKTPDGWVSEFPSKILIATGQRAGPESFYRQIKALKFELEPSDISESDKLNGVQFTGYCQFDHAPVRLYNDPNAFGPPNKWSEWHPSQESAYVQKKNGKWSVEGTAGGYIVAGTKPTGDVAGRLK